MTTTAIREPQPDRVDADVQALARLTDTARPGYTRTAYTDLDLAGRDWATRQMRALGLDTRTDAAGNVIGVLAGERPELGAIMTGSHLDTVDGGGRFDGIVGFVGALEAVRLLAESGTHLQHDLVIVSFFNEEPNRYGLSCVGSRALAGRLTGEHLALRDDDGVHFADALTAAGVDVNGLDSARLRPGQLAAFLELHIEQGPLLEELGCQVGLVTSITGVSRFRALFAGRRGHAGTTPMSRRADAGCAAAASVLAVERIASTHDHARGTTGSVTFSPDAVNVISDAADVRGELRSPDGEWLEHAMATLTRTVTAESASRSVTVEVDWLSHERPVPMDGSLGHILSDTIGVLGYDQARLYSGAEHDAAVMASICPTGMLFVPSHDGLSHCPQEWTDPADIFAGIHTLTTALAAADRQRLD